SPQPFDEPLDGVDRDTCGPADVHDLKVAGGDQLIHLAPPEPEGPGRLEDRKEEDRTSRICRVEPGAGTVLLASGCLRRAGARHHGCRAAHVSSLEQALGLTGAHGDLLNASRDIVQAMPHGDNHLRACVPTPPPMRIAPPESDKKSLVDASLSGRRYRREHKLSVA